MPWISPQWPPVHMIVLEKSIIYRVYSIQISRWIKRQWMPILLRTGPHPMPYNSSSGSLLLLVPWYTQLFGTVSLLTMVSKMLLEAEGTTMTILILSSWNNFLEFHIGGMDFCCSSALDYPLVNSMEEKCNFPGGKYLPPLLYFSLNHSQIQGFHNHCDYLVHLHISEWNSLGGCKPAGRNAIPIRSHRRSSIPRETSWSSHLHGLWSTNLGTKSQSDFWLQIRLLYEDSRNRDVYRTGLWHTAGSFHQLRHDE